MIARDGAGLVSGSFIVLVITFLLWWFFRHPVLLASLWGLGAFSIFNLFFFRDPERQVPDNPQAILSPADGRIVKITEIDEPVYFKSRVWQISIFLSVFNVHVNRVPISGKVDLFEYHPGKFLAAFKDKASLDNEQTAIGIVDDRGRRVLFKQIAGLIARRIICHLREGHRVLAGERMGMIRYGSRVDVFFPLEAQVLVKKGQKVYGGETILAQFNEDDTLEVLEENLVEVPGLEY